MKKAYTFSSPAIDWQILIASTSIALLGLLFIFSATYTSECPYSVFFKKQLFGTVAGIFIYFVFSRIDYRSLIAWGQLGYFGVLALLGFTLLMGHTGMGARRWLDLFFIRVQPSELAKLLLPAFFVYYAPDGDNSSQFAVFSFAPVLCILALSFFLIVKQPDLGTAIIVGFSGLILLFVAQMPLRFFFWLFFILSVSSPVLWYGLKPYQKKRVAVFFDGEHNKKDSYQLEQSMIAIGSGGVWGKGLFNGSQNKLHFLPESRTDFIFAVLCEEWGLMGALLLLFFYGWLFARAWIIALSITNATAQWCAVGLLVPLVLSMMVNMAMVMGLLPIVGIPLPFMSYGVSNLLVNWASLGWFQSLVRDRR